MFNNFSLDDEDVIEILEKYGNLIDKYSKIEGKINEDLRGEIVLKIYKSLTKNRKKKKIKLTCPVLKKM